MHNRPLVLVTRSAPGCFETAERLEAEGFEAVISPAIEICPLPTALPDLEPISGLVFTSANGVRAFCDRSARRDFTAWCVGPATTESAMAAGFQSVHNADGDAETLADIIIQRNEPSATRLLHVANDAAAGNLVKSLENAGFAAEFAPLYTTRPASALAPKAQCALSGGRLSSILVHSAKGAAGLLPAVRAERVDTTCLVAISDRAARPLQTLAWNRIQIADAPNEDALINALRMCYVPE